MVWTRGSAGALLCLCGLIQLPLASCVIRRYFIAAQDLEWEYAASEQDLVNPDQQDYANTYLRQGNDRIGRKYMKTTYFQYTDGTFSRQIPKPEYLGILGPTIRGEVGDAIVVTYFNNASGTYSAHPHGLFYLKQSEGALYLDGTSGRYKNDEIVLQGQTVDLLWNITDTDAPSDEDPNCIPWAYHSHVATVKDTSAGLVGALITCKKGILDANNERTDVAVDIPILLKIYDENLSWYLDNNIAKYCLNPSACKRLKDDEDEDFIESNYMYSLNGKMYGHLKGLEACVGDKVAIYAIGFGNEFDVHSLFFQGQNLIHEHTRGDTVSVYTATFVAAETTPTQAGTWIVSDMVDGMARAGMSAFYTTKNCPQSKHTAQSTIVDREYFLSAEDIFWNYGPGGKDLYTGKNLTDKSNGRSSMFFTQTSSTIGGIYKKARYFQYTDSTYNTKVTRPASQNYMGILGPIIEAEVGDVIRVTLMNKLSFPVSFLPHGLSFNYTEEIGNVAGPKKSLSGIVSPGGKHTYTFRVPSNLLDESGEECQNYAYTSGVQPTKAHNTGLVGPILICQKGYSKIMPRPKELFIFVSMFDENESFLLDENIRYFLHSSLVDKSDEGFKNSNTVYAINGMAFGTITGLTMCYDDDVRWYTMALGGNTDVHSVAFDGNNFRTHGKNRNVQNLVSGSTAALRMKPDNIGTWLVQSITGVARALGAYGLYDVNTCGQVPHVYTYTNERFYYIAAEEMDWDYAPLERALITGADLNDPRDEGNIFIKDDEYFIGDVYKKAVFREYTDSGFTTRKERDSSDRHMDILGPAIRAEVYDKITVWFKNKASRDYSMHPHGLKYTHADSGKTYKTDGANVIPGEMRKYVWYVPPRSGPGPNDPDCIPWVYYSAVAQSRDALSGLVGPVVTCRQGILNKEGRRKSNEPEFFIFMSVFNENLSWYLYQNILKFAPYRIGTNYIKYSTRWITARFSSEPKNVQLSGACCYPMLKENNPVQKAYYRSDPDFEESNKMHSINGRMYGNNPDLVMENNQTIHWYFMVMGSKDDLHTFHTHGHTFIHKSNDHRDDVMSLFPGMAEAVDMKTDNPGTWLLHCHVLDHIAAGMETTYTVLRPGEKVPEDGSMANTIIG